MTSPDEPVVCGSAEPPQQNIWGPIRECDWVSDADFLCPYVVSHFTIIVITHSSAGFPL